MLESKSHLNSAFITLTYNDDHLPFTVDGLTTLCKKDIQNYFKRLRRRLKYEIRYFAVGEYGTKKSDAATFEGERPHYHAIIFGINQVDYDHIPGAWRELNESIGFCYIGTLTNESARYCAGYTIKKLTNPKDDRLFGRNPEFSISSKQKGGIGLQEVIRIARILKKNPYFDIAQVINSFKIGGKSYPLGGYLTNKLFDELGTPEELRKEYLRQWQDRIFEEYKINTSDYYFNICDSDSQKLLNLEKKHKIFKKEKQL